MEDAGDDDGPFFPSKLDDVAAGPERHDEFAVWARPRPGAIGHFSQALNSGLKGIESPPGGGFITAAEERKQALEVPPGFRRNPDPQG